MITLVGTFVAGLAILAATTQGCGGGGGTSAADIASICNKSCVTGVKCAGGLIDMATCVQLCNAGAKNSAGATCSNLDAIVAKAQTCSNITDCTMFESCSQMIPKCQTGSAGTNGGTAGTNGGTAGTSSGGTAGASGSNGAAGVLGTAGVLGGGGVFGGAGTAGSTCDTACTKADACCNALNSADAGVGTCNNKMNCDMAGTQTSTAVAICNAFLQSAPVVAQFQNVTLPNACK
jgi:hypothetical protein